MKIKQVFILTALFLSILIFTACDGSMSVSGGTRIVTDVREREVEIPADVKTIITLGPGATRLAAYLNVIDMIIGGEEQTANYSVLMDFNVAHHETLASLPIAGAGGGSGNNNGFPEEIIMLNPDVIIAAFDAEAADELQSQTGIPVVSVRHTTGLAPESFYDAMRVFAEVVGAQKRCEELLTYIDNLKLDLHNRTVGVSDSAKLNAYAGAVTWNGRRGFAGTYSIFGIFDAINAKNAAYTPSIDGFFEADFESIIIWDPDIIFLDPGNMDLVNEEYAINPGYFNSLHAVQEDNVYTLPAFNFSGTNITYALISAYYAGIVLFPEQFADINIADKAAEILNMFLGKNIYEDMAKDGLYYGKIRIGE